MLYFTVIGIQFHISIITMHSSIVFSCLFLVYNVKAQDCSCGMLPSNLPVPLRNLLSLASPLSLSNVLTPCACVSPCGCGAPNCVCGNLIQAPMVPPYGCYNPAIGLQNPVIGIQSCGCTNSIGACTCGNPVIGNLCGRTTPAVGLATTCGCNDPAVRIVDGCPRCQPVYSYNLPSIGCPTCGMVAPSFPGGYPGYGCGCGAPIVPYGLPCGCSPCGCSGPCTCGNSCGCVEVPCGLPKVKTTCTCVTPTVETPCGCAQGKPTCACATTVEIPTCGVPVLPPFAPVIGCSRYLRQVVVQPPFM